MSIFVCSVCRLQEDSDYIFNDNTDTSALLEPQAHFLIQHLARSVLQQNLFIVTAVCYKSVYYDICFQTDRMVLRMVNFDSSGLYN